MNISEPSTKPHCALYPPAPCSPAADQIVCGSMVISNNSLKQMSAVLAQFISSFQYKSCTRFVMYSFIKTPFPKRIYRLNYSIGPAIIQFLYITDSFYKSPIHKFFCCTGLSSAPNADMPIHRIMPAPLKQDSLPV